MKKYILSVFILMFSLLVSIGIGVSIKNNSIDNIDNNIILLKKEINKINIDIKNEKIKLKEIAKNDIVKKSNLIDKTIDELKIIVKENKPKTVEDIKNDLGQVQDIFLGIFAVMLILILGFKIANEFDLID